MASLTRGSGIHVCRDARQWRERPRVEGLGGTCKVAPYLVEGKGAVTRTLRCCVVNPLKNDIQAYYKLVAKK